jgi:hypothetical protein
LGGECEKPRICKYFFGKRINLDVQYYLLSRFIGKMQLSKYVVWVQA